MPDDPAVLLERDAGDPAVAVLTLNRPARYNALTVELKTALLAAVRDVAADGSIRALVITGAGKAFCVGQDLGEHAEALRADPATAFATVAEHYNPIVLGLADLPFPVIAAINGPCVGAGLGFALACDLRIAAAGLKFATAFTGIGLTADSGLSASLAHAVGVSRATELLLLGEPFTAVQAREWGLVWSVVAEEALDACSWETAIRLAALAPEVARQYKRVLNQVGLTAFDAAICHENAAHRALMPG